MSCGIGGGGVPLVGGHGLRFVVLEDQQLTTFKSALLGIGEVDDQRTEAIENFRPF